ncbi:MAG: hypothetical protein ACP5OU_09035, partial [Methanothrix sp.]
RFAPIAHRNIIETLFQEVLSRYGKDVAHYGPNTSDVLGRGRSGVFGNDLRDQCGPTDVSSYQSDEYKQLELRGANYPNYAMNVGHQGEYAGISAAAHAGRMDAFAINPLIKVTFANPGLVFDWADVRASFGKGSELRAGRERFLGAHSSL